MIVSTVLLDSSVLKEQQNQSNVNQDNCATWTPQSHDCVLEATSVTMRPNFCQSLVNPTTTVLLVQAWWLNAASNTPATGTLNSKDFVVLATMWLITEFQSLQMNVFLALKESSATWTSQDAENARQGMFVMAVLTLHTQQSSANTMVKFVRKATTVHLVQVQHYLVLPEPTIQKKAQSQTRNV